MLDLRRELKVTDCGDVDSIAILKKTNKQTNKTKQIPTYAYLCTHNNTKNNQ